MMQAEAAISTPSWSLFEGVSDATFRSERYEQRPFLGTSPLHMAMTPEAVFAVLPAAHAAGTVRYISSDTTEQGLNPEQVRAELVRASARDDGEAYAQFFARGSISFAIQRFEEHFPAVQEAADRVRAFTGRSVSVTAFLSPPCSTATKVHYDKSDVFAVQLLGEKQWDIFRPVDDLPSHRTPYVSFDVASLEPFDTHLLGERSVLYLPRGWIHRVVNRSDHLSLHLSFVVFADSWTSLFGNLMDAAYAKLRDSPSWREGIVFDQLDPAMALHRINRMSQELAQSMIDIMGSKPQTFLDHCVNGSCQRHAIDIARQSLRNADAHIDYVLEPSGAHYLLRHGDHGSQVRVSVDGNHFLVVDARLFRNLVTAGRMRLSALEADCAGNKELLLEALEVLVHRFGIYKLVSVTKQVA